MPNSRKPTTEYLAILTLALVALASSSPAAEVQDLRCEYRKDPLGIDLAKPRLSWRINSDRRGDRQSAFQVLVASSPEALTRDQGDRWDSGKVFSDQSLCVDYAGRPLTSGQQCFWKVRIWDRDGKPSAWSPPARWAMGLLAADDWKARWIAATPDGAARERQCLTPPGRCRSSVGNSRSRNRWHGPCSTPADWGRPSSGSMAA